jgi:hypothetical protein
MLRLQAMMQVLFFQVSAAKLGVNKTPAAKTAA